MNLEWERERKSERGGVREKEGDRGRERESHRVTCINGIRTKNVLNTTPLLQVGSTVHVSWSEVLTHVLFIL